MVITAPLLENYDHSFLTAEYGIDLYPVELKFEGNTYFCDTEDYFLSTLEEILTSDKARKIISSLLTQSRFNGQEPLLSIDDTSVASIDISEQPPSEPSSSPAKPQQNTPEPTPSQAPAPQIEGLKAGLPLRKNHTSELNSIEKEVLTRTNPQDVLGLIHCTHINEEFISVAYRHSTTGKPYEVSFPTSPEGIESFHRVFQFDPSEAINENKIAHKPHTTIFPNDLI